MVLGGTERKTLEELQTDLEDQRELAQNRMGELDRLNSNYKECLQTVEKLKMELSTLPEYVVVETTEHKCLQVGCGVWWCGHCGGGGVVVWWCSGVLHPASRASSPCSITRRCS